MLRVTHYLTIMSFFIGNLETSFDPQLGRFMIDMNDYSYYSPQQSPLPNTLLPCHFVNNFNANISHVNYQTIAAFHHKCLQWTQTLITTKPSTFTFTSMRSKLPPHFENVFEHHNHKIHKKFKNNPKERYEAIFYYNLVQQCNGYYTFEQLAQYHYAQMHEWAHYYYKGFIEFIKTFPFYEDYIVDLDSKFKQNTHFAEKVWASEQKAYEHITQEAARINAKRSQEKTLQEQERIRQQQQIIAYRNQQKRIIAQEFFLEQNNQLHQHIYQWQNNHPDRFYALQQTVTQPNKNITQTYTLSHQAQALLKQNNSQYWHYETCEGNQLQQQLHREIIEGIEKISTLPFSRTTQSFGHTIHTTTIETYDAARYANAMGDCLSASKLIDLATAMIDCCTALVGGVFDGVIDGTADAITGTYHLIRHPIETLKSLGNVALKVAELLHDYVPLYKPQFLCITKQEKLAAQQYHDEIAHNWSQAHKKFLHWWDETPTHEKIYEVTKGTTNTITNIIIGNKCLEFIGKISKIAAAETLTFYKKTHPQAVIAGTGISIEIDAASELMHLSDADKIIEAPATVVLGKIEATSSLIEYGKKFQLTTEQALETLRIIEEDGCSIERFHQAIKELGNVPGSEKTIERIFSLDKQGDFFKVNAPCVRGGYFELESGLKIAEQGTDKIIAMSSNQLVESVSREIDIITTSSFVECKNWDWAYQKDLSYSFTKLKTELGSRKKIAESQHKKMVLHSKHPLPNEPEFNKFKNWLIEKSIELVEG